MAVAATEEGFLPRLVSVFYATFHPIQGPKVIYQVPEGSVTDERIEAEKAKRRGEVPSHNEGNPVSNSAASWKGKERVRPYKIGGSESETEEKEEARKDGSSRIPPPEPLFDFSSLSEYLIPKAPLCGRLVICNARRIPSKDKDARRKQSVPPSDSVSRSRSRTCSGIREMGNYQEHPGAGGGRGYKILGFPVLLEDQSKYQRNNFIFNLCFVFDGQADVHTYEPIVRKCGRVLKDLEESQSFLSSPKSMPRMYAIIEQLFEDLNSYSESFVALPEAPFTSYMTSEAKPESPKSAFTAGNSPLLNAQDYLSLSASAAGLQKARLNSQQSGLTKIQQEILQESIRREGLRKASLGSEVVSRSGSSTSETRSRAGSDASSAEAFQAQARQLRSSPSSKRPSFSGRSFTTHALTPTLSETGTSTSTSSATARSSRPIISRSSTVTALTGATASATTVSPPLETLNLASSTTMSRRASVEEEAQGGRATNHAELSQSMTATEAVAAALSARRSSQGSLNATTPTLPIDMDTSSVDHSNMSDSILSLKTIDAALSNSVVAGSSMIPGLSQSKAVAEKREPPHGLGRTVRDAINLKLFPTYSNPPTINDWDVPIALLDLGERVDGNWDLTMKRVLPFIDGVNHVKRIAQLADADLGLTRACMEHLFYYNSIMIVDIFQYFNMYTLRPSISRLADDQALGRECAAYVARPGYPTPSYPQLLKLYSLLRAGQTLHDWIEDNDIDAKGIDVRRFVSFGVLQGFLRRVHRYPVLLYPQPAADDAEAEGAANRPDTVANKDGITPKSPEVVSKLKRDESGSREARDRRSREISGQSEFQLREQSLDGRKRSMTPQRRTASDFEVLDASMLSAGTGATGGKGSHISFNESNLSMSPTKHRGLKNRRGYQQKYPTTTVLDVASVVFEAEPGEREPRGDSPPTPGMSGIANATGWSRISRSPRKRASGYFSLQGRSGSGFARSAQTPASYRPPDIPPELPELLDGTHCDDELCVRFGLSWPELERKLVYLGSRADWSSEVGAGGDSDEEASRNDWRKNNSSLATVGGGGGGVGVSGLGGVSGVGSGWGRAKMSGFSGVQSGVAGVGGRSRLTNESVGPNSSGIWGVDSEEANLSGVMTMVDRLAVETGDLGRVKILLQ
ncbi:NPR2-domain-containing protein [Violaceomyces palustris]|uniref:NPR2-domain-containing protein n=1 Tax=Violaceomyces palustris TaxID=1673888 RepID=A0ACD0NWY3_9BASI|nr:NPR2-domain-containing protein [Violaceomyces palustris]